MRLFSLINQSGDVLDLNNMKMFLEHPTGLGKSVKIEGYSPYPGYYKVTKQETVLPPLDGTVQFISDENNSAYSYFDLFMIFVERSTELYVEYEVPSEIENFDSVRKGKSRVILKNIEKTELDEFGILSCPVSFERLTPFMGEIKEIKLILDSFTNAVYDNEVEYNDEVEYGNDSAGAQKVNNWATSYMPIRIIFTAPSTNPTVNVISVKTGKTVSSWKYLGTLASTDKLDHQSDPIKQYIKINSNNGYQNVVKSPGYSSFIFIPPGEHMIVCTQEQPVAAGPITAYYSPRWDVM